MPRISKAPAEGGTIVINQAPPPAEMAQEEIRKKETIELWSYIKSLSPADWNRHIVYLYRTKPLTGMTSKERYLDKFSQAFTIDDIKERFGGEEFKVMLLRDGKPLGDFVFAVEATPKYDLTRERPPDSARMTAASQAADAVTQKVVDQFLDERRGESDMFSEAHKKSLDIVADGFKKAQEITGGQQQQGGGGNSNIIETIRVLKELGLVGQPQRSAASEMLEMIKAAKELGLIPAAPAAPQNPMEIAKSAIDMVKTLAGDIGLSGGGGGKSAGLVQTLIDRGPDLLEKVVDGIGKVAEIRQKDNEALQIKANTAVRLRAMQPQASGQPEIPQAMPGGRGGYPPSRPTPGGIDEFVPHPTGGLDVVSGDAANGSGFVDTNPAKIMSAPLTLDQVENVLFNHFKIRIVNIIHGGGKPEEECARGADIVAFAEDYDPRIFELMLQMNAKGLRAFFAEDEILKGALMLPRWEKVFAEACEELYGEAEDRVIPN